VAAIAFMPWCRVDKSCDLGEIRIIRFERDHPVEGIDGSLQSNVQTILGTYKDITGKPVAQTAIVALRDKNVLDDLNDDDRDLLYETVDVIRFGGLANREYFNPIGRYCNSDCFTCYVQRFSTTEFTSLSSRRREGSTLSMWPLSDISITIPLHCSSIKEVVLDDVVIASLLAYRKGHEKDWPRLINAISSFAQANTDAENFRYQVEWVLLCSAFEHLLEADSKAIDVAMKFTDVFGPSKSKLVREARRRSARFRDDGQPLRFEWMKEFYRVRGDFAHGKLQTGQDMAWGLGEHLVLATIAFPLLVKILLHKDGVYRLTDEDVSEIEGFELLADTPRFTYAPSDARSSMDSHWGRIRRETRRMKSIEDIIAEIEKMRPDNAAESDDRVD
jgi:hypothetical protein